MFSNKIFFCLFLILNGLIFHVGAESLPLSDEAKSVKRGIYQHYKGNLYEVIGVAHHSETLEELVTYRMLYGDYGYWIRPVTMFNETVIDFKNEVVPRFRFLGEPGNF